MEPSRYVIIVKAKDGYGTLVTILYAMVEQYPVISVLVRVLNYVQAVTAPVKDNINS